jgi:hypothetical protein
MVSDRINDLPAILVNGQCRVVSEFHNTIKNTSRTLGGNVRANSEAPRLCLLTSLQE